MDGFQVQVSTEIVRELHRKSSHVFGFEKQVGKFEAADKRNPLLAEDL